MNDRSMNTMRPLIGLFAGLVFLWLGFVCWQAWRLWQVQQWQARQLTVFADQVLARFNEQPIRLADISDSALQATLFFEPQALQQWQQRQPYYRVSTWHTEPLRLNFWHHEHDLRAWAWIEDGQGQRWKLSIQWTPDDKARARLIDFDWSQQVIGW